MGKTISCSAGPVAVNHDRRDYDKESKKKEYPENVNPDMAEHNIYVKTCSNAGTAFNDFFRESVDEYNSRQNRADRKKTDYYAELQKSKNGETPVYEYVFQIGNKDDTPCMSEDGFKTREILTRYAKSFEKDNPNFHVISSCVHMDEATPHLHITFIPWADGYKKGLKKRCSTSKALESMGYKGEERNMRSWKQAQEEKIECMMAEYQMERVRMENKRERVSVAVYKEIKEQALADAKAELQQLEEDMHYLKTDYEAVEQDFKEYLEERESLIETISDLKAERSTLEGARSGLKAVLSKLSDTIKELVGIAKKTLQNDVVMGAKAIEFIKAKNLTQEFQKFLYEPVKDAEKELEGYSMSQWKNSIDRSSSSAEPIGKPFTKTIVAEKNKDVRS